MVFYLSLALGFALAAIIIRIYRSVFFSLAENSVALLDKLLTDVEDDEKIRLIQGSNSKLLLSLLKMVFTLVIALAAASVPVILFIMVTGTDFHSLDFLSLWSILAISIGATIPFLIPLKSINISGYSELSQLLHRLALDNYTIAYRLFKKEKKKIERRKLERRQDFIIISGLARAGTTSFMTDLSKIGDFVSLNYGNMPFLLSPNLWAKIYKPRSRELKERSHKDGIMIGLDSSEALEEFFFKVKAGDSYIHEEVLNEYSIPEDDYIDYIDYQTIIKLDDSKIYLAKNNNFILRYRSVREYNKDFMMVILFRDPLTHASSLLEKHLDYRNMQNEDRFILEYMDWLGHHEFGLHQKQFVFQEKSNIISGDRDKLDYWLKIWMNYYTFVLGIKDRNTLLINYDAYCTNPTEVIEKIVRKSGITAELPDYRSFTNKRKAEHDYSPDILKMADTIYQQLVIRSMEDHNLKN